MELDVFQLRGLELHVEEEEELPDTVQKGPVLDESVITQLVAMDFPIDELPNGELSTTRMVWPKSP